MSGCDTAPGREPSPGGGILTQPRHDIAGKPTIREETRVTAIRVCDHCGIPNPCGSLLNDGEREEPIRAAGDEQHRAADPGQYLPRIEGGFRFRLDDEIRVGSLGLRQDRTDRGSCRAAEPRERLTGHNALQQNRARFGTLSHWRAGRRHVS